MKLIKSSVEILPQPPGIEGVYKQIEIAGRTCYKSEDKITEASAKKFVDMLIDRGHTAMLEHGTVYLRCAPWGCTLDRLYNTNPYTRRINPVLYQSDMYITTNYRVLLENHCLEDLQYLCEPTEYHDKRISVRFICDRGIMAELTRHRTFSFAVESTRYCNYSKDKFNNELTYITPDKENWKGLDAYYQMLNCLDEIESVYMKAIEEGVTPQIARSILPNSLKTEVVMTGFVDDWKYFFELRCAKSAHPDMQVLANQLKDELEKQGLI